MSPKSKFILASEFIASRIFFIRGQKVMLDRDLAELYAVPVKALNQAVKRNHNRFPSDFMFVLSRIEKKELVTNCDRFSSLKHTAVMPYTFTEQGVAMLSTVLRSKKAIEANIQIMRVFVKLRKFLSTQKSLLKKLGELERRADRHDTDIRSIFEAIRQLMAPPPEKLKKFIGFHP